ncbi:hypothetical protein [Microbacterium lacticum]|uniref:hypothetical protein n=1 Tax=Microbacterium lacticum TaxID=33885 RepID=UPI0028D4F90A|nr:hypothetical protein [Microbacterium lacticum]
MSVFSVAATAYTFFVTLLARGPATAMTLGIGFVASRFFAWQLLQTALWSVAWGFAALSSVI